MIYDGDTRYDAEIQAPDLCDLHPDDEDRYIHECRTHLRSHVHDAHLAWFDNRSYNGDYR